MIFSSSMAQLVKALSLKDLPPGQMKPVGLGGLNILLVNLEGEVLAVSNLCTHEEAYLSNGKLEDGAVSCPLHESQFDLKTGEVLFPPAEKPLPVYKVKIKDDTIFVEI
jgi:nitrite reductase/ring-hydroxylating ferredoxin subunit